MTLSQFSDKWEIRFANNDSFDISEADLREFKNDCILVFGNQLANIPLYAAGMWYVPGNLVRYLLSGTPESFYYALKAGQLPAPSGPGDLNWKVVPGPVVALALSQTITLLQAQGIEQDQVVAGRTYLIDLGPNGQGYTQTVTVRGVSNNSFDIEGTLEVNGLRTAIWVNVASGTFAPKKLPIASATQLGVVKGDNNTIAIAADGTISANLVTGNIDPASTPTNVLAVLTNGGYSAYISWDLMPDATWYQVYRSVNGGPWTLIIGIPYNYFTDTSGVTQGGSALVVYRITAANGLGESPPSSLAQAA